MDLRSLMNPVVSDGQAQAQSQLHLQTPQRTLSLAQPLTYNTHSSPIQQILPRTTSLPAQATHYRRESSLSVSPKTMPPPAPVPFQTPSPVMSRKRSLSISDSQHTPQPVAKKRKYDPKSPPPWARRERDGYRFVLTARSVPLIENSSVTAQPNHQASAPPSAAVPTQINSHLGTPPEHCYEPRLDNNEPYNDLERQICDFLFQNVVSADWRFNSPTKVEIEAKLGSIKDWNDERSRLRLPILNDVVLDPQAPRPKFESSMKFDQHARLNQYLNNAVAQSKRPGRKEIKYNHLHETDYFYEIPHHALQFIDPYIMSVHNQSGRKGAPRLRVTRNNKTNEITAVIIKTRLQDMEVRCPNDEFDFRISVSLETPWTREGWQQFPEHLDHGVRTTRNKDRLSYQHQGFSVDLTQVTPFAREGEKPEKLHELEIEMDVDKLMDEGFKNLNNQPNEYTDLIHVFVNNIKVVNRAAKATPAPLPQQQPQGPLR